MPLKRRRSPQEKKALSYAKDRRGDYWGNNKGGRKSVPRSKAKAHRANRRRAATKLSMYESLSESSADLVENEIARDVYKSKRFRKDPGVPLGDSVRLATRKRESLVGRKTRAKKAREEAKKRGALGVGRSSGPEGLSFWIVENGVVVQLD